METLCIMKKSLISDKNRNIIYGRFIPKVVINKNLNPKMTSIKYRIKNVQ